MNKSFAERLSEDLGKAQKPEFDQAYAELRGIAEGICAAVSKGKPGLEVTLEPGYTTNLGQQFRLRLAVPTRNWSETLLRAYLPSEGFPVNLDLGDETPVACADKQALDDAVLRFMRKPEIANRMSIVRDML